MGPARRADLLDPSSPDVSSTTTSLSAKVEIIFFKNLLFLLVNRPLPSTFTKYWSKPSFSTILPDLFHLLGVFPRWFWIWTRSPMSRLGRFRAPSLRFRSICANFTARACSLISLSNLHSFLTFRFSIVEGRWSLRFRPNRMFEGLTPRSLQGVFLNSKIALLNLSQFSVPEGPVFSRNNLFIDFTPNSALVLALG